MRKIRVNELPATEASGPSPGSDRLIGGGPPTYPPARPPTRPIAASPAGEVLPSMLAAVETRQPVSVTRLGLYGCAIVLALVMLCTVLALPDITRRVRAAQYARDVRDICAPAQAAVRTCYRKLQVVLGIEELFEVNVDGLGYREAKRLEAEARKLELAMQDASRKLQILSPPPLATDLHASLLDYCRRTTEFARMLVKQMSWYSTTVEQLDSARRALNWVMELAGDRAADAQLESVRHEVRSLRQKLGSPYAPVEAQATQKAAEELLDLVQSAAEDVRLMREVKGPEAAIAAAHAWDERCEAKLVSVAMGLREWAGALRSRLPAESRAMTVVNDRIRVFHDRSRIMAEDRIPPFET